MACPIPLVAPVTNTTLSLRRESIIESSKVAARLVRVLEHAMGFGDRECALIGMSGCADRLSLGVGAGDSGLSSGSRAGGLGGRSVQDACRSLFGAGSEWLTLVH